ncbi:unnamed protein product [Brassica napus]|uniref:(rape) hypothetical protein n=1 Tax=Brassica napus TaxID=3708 RepID=A0A816P2U2_BRANA|nr:unnamed protein product [Brassica napus]
MEHPKEQIYCCFAEEGRKEDEAIQLYSQRLMMKTMLRMVVKRKSGMAARVVLTKSTTALLPKANEVSRLKLLRTMTKSRSQQDDALYWCIVEAILPGKVKPQDAVKDILKEFMENI